MSKLHRIEWKNYEYLLIIQVLHGSRKTFRSRISKNKVSLIHVSRKIKSPNHASRKYPGTTLFYCIRSPGSEVDLKFPGVVCRVPDYVPSLNGHGFVGEISGWGFYLSCGVRRHSRYSRYSRYSRCSRYSHYSRYLSHLRYLRYSGYLRCSLRHSDHLQYSLWSLQLVRSTSWNFSNKAMATAWGKARSQESGKRPLSPWKLQVNFGSGAWNVNLGNSILRDPWPEGFAWSVKNLND